MSNKRLSPGSNPGNITSTTITTNTITTSTVVNVTTHNANTISASSIPVVANSKNEETLPEITHFKDDAQVKLQEQQRLQEKEQERMQIKQMRENLETMR